MDVVAQYEAARERVRQVDAARTEAVRELAAMLLALDPGDFREGLQLVLRICPTVDEPPVCRSYLRHPKARP